MINKKLIIKITFMIMILTLIGCSVRINKSPSEPEISRGDLPKDKTPIQDEKPEPQQVVDPIEREIKNMTLEEKMGQMLIVGFDGYTIDDNTRAMIEDNHVGGFILFGHNIQNSEQLLTLVNSLKSGNSKNKVPLFISVDEEGGRVSRMTSEFKKLPSNKIIGTFNDEDLSYKIGNILAEEIKSFGFNMNFAPVLDINSNPKNPVIGDRSFGVDPELVSKLGVQTMKGIQGGDLIPVIKHFPGHGDTSVDSHIGLPSVSSDMDRLKSFELLPFKDAIKNGADGVMIAHILLDKIDPENPASMSKTIITDMLRKQLDFNGIIITDDMTMGAIVENYNIGDAAIKSVKAGTDIVLVCHGYDNVLAVITALKGAVEDNIISKENIDESVYRILKLKNKYNLTDNIIDSIDIERINRMISEINF